MANGSVAQNSVFRSYIKQGDKAKSNFREPSEKMLQAGRDRRKIEDLKEEKKLKQQLSDDFYGQYAELLDEN